MFEGTLHSAMLEQKEKIDFKNLQFPIYRKEVNRKEFYRFESLSKMISVRTKDVKAIGIVDELPDDFFCACTLGLNAQKRSLIMP